MELTPFKDLNAIALKTFRVWSKQAKYHYQSVDFYAAEEQIVQDFTSALEKSLEEIKRKGYEQHRQRPGWGSSVYLTLLAKNLHFYWHNVFVLGASPEYKTAVWLRATLSYIDKHPEAIKNINRLYTAAIEQRFPFEQQEKTMLSKDEITQHHLVADLNYTMNWDMHRKQLTEQLKETFRELLDQRGPRFLSPENFYEFIDLQELDNFLELNLHIL
ncbi:hypothetical protein [Algivirga pacifica]|uniref:DUF547 domain-containing protein n=1 Tax=Algivirga pacifica TaxID=1162670 RepID=A0ABP9DCW7_9BACT